MNISLRDIDRAINNLCSELAALNSVLEQAEKGHYVAVSSSICFSVDILFDQQMLSGVKEAIKQKEDRLQLFQSARDAAQNKIDEIIAGNVPYAPGDQIYISRAPIK